MTPRSGSPRRARAAVAAAVVVLLLGAGCADGGDVAVELAEVESGTVVQTIAAPASIQPVGSTDVVAPIPGHVAELLVEDGGAVEAGEPVLRLESSSVDVAIAQAQAAAAAAGDVAAIPPTADLSPIFGDLRAQLEDTVPPLLDAVQAQLPALPAAVRPAVEARLLEARTEYAETVDDLADAQATASAAANRSTATQRAIAEAQQEQAEAALQAAQAQEDALTVTAPRAGFVEFATGSQADAPSLPPELGGPLGSGGGAGAIEVGARVVTGQTLFTVYDLSEFHAEATVDEVDAVLVETGQDAIVLVDAYPEERFEGQVARVGIGPSSGESGAVVYPVTVRFAADGAEFRVGMTASVEVDVKRVRADTVVPTRALLRRDDRDVVLVARDGRVEEVEVRLLAVGSDDAAVRGELEAGDEVVVAGFEELEDGDRLP